MSKELPKMEAIQYQGVLYVREQDCRANIDFVLALKQKEIDALKAQLAEAERSGGGK